MTDAQNSVLSSGTMTRAYLFSASDNPSIHAVTRDALGSKLPAHESGREWVLDPEFVLGVREVMPIKVAPEPILRRLAADGYFIWCEGSNPFGTSQ